MPKVRSISPVLQMLRKDLTPYERAARQENVSYVSIEQEIEEAEAKEANLESISYMGNLHWR